MDTAELEALAESTALGLSRANQRLLDLEANLTTHVGLDWGSTGVNYPHPNMSADTVEFGGGIDRLDRSGIQVKTQSSQANPAIYFVDEFSIHPNDRDALFRGLIQGLMDPDTVLGSANVSSIASWFLAAGGEGGEASWDITGAKSGSNFHVEAVRMEPGGIINNHVFFHVLATNTALWVSIRNDFSSRNVPLYFYGSTQDPTYLNAGMIWYRTDTGKFGGRYNSTTDNFAMEAWVNAAITAVKRYDTIQDEGVGLTQRNTINFVGTGVTASDLAGITTVTVPGGALDSANEFWLARSQQAGRGGVLA